MWGTIKNWFQQDESKSVEVPTILEPVESPVATVELPKAGKKRKASKPKAESNDSPEVKQTKGSKKSKAKSKTAAVLTAKEQATAEGRPYVNVIGLEFDPDNPVMGSFELEWNELFVKQLMQAGYRGTSDEQIVDQWFQTVCRNIANEEYEQYAADPDNRMINRKNLGGGRYEAS